ncbi:MAG: quercetin 2,3-dioxygenase [Alteromonadaceae bacterium]|nr:quercetin 2,3-dioxygenase [Alteromonadaceae bacterium]MBH84346.1 quercetin 2,3-dioxygenase [Alteromonadaceae bacterium]|tara:strand:+ start:4801 stop:5769 length:969 start_codon:yes stop_codon:yes gene_type:complete
MTNTEYDPELSPSRDAPAIDGEQVIHRIVARMADVGGIPVARSLPSRQRRTIGAWCFLDHAGPAVFKGDSRGLHVGPHPHIGLQTFTWMLEGEVLHRDSLGSEQVIRPGQVNLMTAGSGISHTEESVAGETRLHAAQLWIALPYNDRKTAPRFDHYPYLPQWEEQGAKMTLLVGRFRDHNAQTLAFSPLVGVDLQLETGGEVTLPLRGDYEYGVLPLEGEIRFDDEAFGVDELAYLGAGRGEVAFTAQPGSRALLVGGEPLREDILIWWNFVGHNKSEIAEAQADWESGDARFGRITGFDGPSLVAPPLPWSVLMGDEPKTD